jgi:hypothetical protein
MAMLVVACVVVRRTVLDPSALTIDQVVNLGDLSRPDIRMGKPV